MLVDWRQEIGFQSALKYVQSLSQDGISSKHKTRHWTLNINIRNTAELVSKYFSFLILFLRLPSKQRVSRRWSNVFLAEETGRVNTDEVGEMNDLCSPLSAYWADWWNI